MLSKRRSQMVVGVVSFTLLVGPAWTAHPRDSQYGASAFHQGSVAAAQKGVRTLVFVTKAFPDNFVVVNQRGKRLVGVAGTMGSEDYGCVSGNTRSGKLRSVHARDFLRASGQGSGKSFTLTTFYVYRYQKPVERRSLVPTTLRHLSRLAGTPGDPGRWLRDVRSCAATGEVGAS